MLNKQPIFLNCFSRGGSNIFWNIFLTHPDVCSPIRETLEIFRTNWRDPHWEGYIVALLSGQLNLFNQWKLENRKPIPEHAKKFIDSTLYRRKMNTYTDKEMRFKYPDHAYTIDEVEQARLVTKNNNGLFFLSDIFIEMYPDATFFGLIRDPIPLYESHRRRKISKSPEEFSKFYNKIAERALFDKQRFKSYHIVRFEDILNDPLKKISRLYSLSNLDPDKVGKLRFAAKPHYQRDGSHGSHLPVYHHYWFDKDRIYDILEPEINRLQQEHISPSECQKIAELTHNNREKFGYI